ncbi:MAG: methyltransferase domain-containing protein [bacterium]
MKLKEIQHKQSNEERIRQYNYNGIPIFCTGGIHENIFNEFEKLNKIKNISVLVLGSGAGAFEQRLLANGYNNITSVEFIPEVFMVKGTKLLTINLNQDFSHLGKFDVIFAIEIIEHLENQFNFMRCVKNLMKKDSVFYLSTPNVENTFARIKYFLVGRLQWFSPGDIEATGRVNPIFNHILKFNLSQNKLKINKYFGNSNIYHKLFQHKKILIKAIYYITFIFSFLMINRNNYEINLFEIINDEQ